MAIKILVLEDEMSIRSFVKIKLRKLGYEIIEAERGEEAFEKADESISIALLDVMLPDIDGFEVCRRLRIEYPRMGIIMLTAKGQEDDKIIGLSSGADDYIVKPFSPRELVARIESLLRRIEISAVDKTRRVIDIGIYELDMDRRVLKKNGEIISLTPTEYAIVEFLINNSEKTFSRNEILDEVWGKSFIGDMKIVDVNIRRIRQKIEDDPANPRYLKTVWGHGYIWSIEK
ncbi:transcriptional regulatory protein SrrA [Clostridium tepidiprofundi DSM 19306]|uniref:Stage 0 sporulation protein A homolog n=1 Tax=Clostridium tepidiprofundi DSM 19306 TaxID=1121338 RepID=A0A151B4H5_9CLOT|nr:response regulator transcription factor [Clostridium tepidiprofundi]KYH34703.1 transcriptional regulatory protein SrrA [Clostridium tepidiprofundi DSM 19306]